MIKSTIRKIVRWAHRDEPEKISSDSYATQVRSTGTREQLGEGMNITVYSAVGGKVISMNSYDHARDRVKVSLYVVTDREDLGEELGQIITRECLTR